MDSIEVDKLYVDEARLKHWVCTLMFEVAGLEGEYGILQYVKPNVLAKDFKMIMECTAKGFPKKCMMRFPYISSGGSVWDKLKSVICNTSDEDGYML
jgi:hypothetical protein